jgi:hypothetical protein
LTSERDLANLKAVLEDPNSSPEELGDAYNLVGQMVDQLGDSSSLDQLRDDLAQVEQELGEKLQQK